MTNSYSSIKKIVEVITDLEKRYNLLDWQINDVYAWQSARVLIYISILDLLLANNSSPAKLSVFKKLKITLRRLFVNSFVLNPFLDFSRSDVLIFESGRKYLVDNRFIDIYTEYIMGDIENHNASYTRYDTNYQYDHLNNRKCRNKHIDFINIFSKIVSRFLRTEIISENKISLKKLEKELNIQLDIKLDLESIIKSEIIRYKSEYPFYNLLYKIKKPKTIYLTGSGEKAALIKAARDRNIIVNELQHGLIVNEGLISHYPDTLEDSLAYFPDRFFVWKDLEMCTSKLPLSDRNIVCFTNRHLENMLERSSRFSRNPNQILVISQPFCSKEILEFVLGNISSLRDYQFIYKIHPSENHDYFSNIKEKHLSKVENLTFVNNEVSVYQLFAESAYVVGVFSTALFEASYFNCKIFLLDLPGVEIANSLIDKGKAILISPEEKLESFL